MPMFSSGHERLDDDDVAHLVILVFHHLFLKLHPVGVNKYKVSYLEGIEFSKSDL